MSKPLRSMSVLERRKAIARRLASGTKGLGYWAAVDAQRKEQQMLSDMDIADVVNSVRAMNSAIRYQRVVETGNKE